MKHSGKTAFGIFLTVFLLWFVMKDVDFADVIANIAKGDVLLLSGKVGCFLIQGNVGFGISFRMVGWNPREEKLGCIVTAAKVVIQAGKYRVIFPHRFKWLQEQG